MIGLFLRHPTAANLLMMAFLLLGILTVGTIKRETFPEFSPPYIQAFVIYPGASPSEVEQSLCLRMEDAVDGLSNIEETYCNAQEGSGTLTLKMEEGTDIGRSLIDVQTQINAIQDFPSQIEPPVVKELDWAEPVVDIAIAAQTNWPNLKAYAEDVKERMKRETSLNLITVSGFSDHLIQVEVNEADVRRLGLSVAGIADMISKQNINTPAGNIELEDKTLLVRFDQREVTTTALARTVVASGADGGVVRLGDIATLTERFELDEEYVTFNGKPAAILKIQKNKSEDALRLKQEVQAFVDKERQLAPEGVTLTLTNDLTSLLNDRLQMMISNGWQGILLVFATMWLFFSMRYSFWVSAGLPVAFMGGLFLMSLFGVSINIMSLVALLMAIGIMMDDAIVIAESIASHLEKDKDILRAITRGTAKVVPGVISSFLTTVFIFGSLLWLEGQMGAVLKAIPLVLIMVLSVSLVEAFLILPHHLAHSLQHKHKEHKPVAFKQAFLQRFEAFRNHRLPAIVAYMVRWRYAAVGGVFGLLLASFALLAGGVLKFVPFPELDGDIAEARIILPPGSALSQTEEVVAHLIESARIVGQRLSDENGEDAPLIQDITAQFNYNADAGESGPHVATVRLDILSAETRETLIDDLLDRWREQSGEIPLALSLVFKQPAMGPAGRDIEVRMQHDDLDQLKQASVALQLYLGQFSGVNGILDDMRPGKEEIVARLKPGAESYGVDGMQVANQLRAAFFGQTADEIQVGPENIEIQVKLNEQQAGNLQRLYNFPLILADGSTVPLIAVAELSTERGYVKIRRIEGRRTVTVMADVDNSKANGAEILAKVRNEFVPELKDRFPGVETNFEGAAKETAKTGTSLATGFVIGLFGLFAILSFQFKSYLEPFVVMLAIPLALIGVLWGHVLLGYSMSMPSVMGFISLAGIVVNDSILLVQYIRHHVDQGDKVHQAVVAASRERFRAVFITSLTTAAGLLPLLLETSLQAQVVKPLVVSIVFGIFSSTLLVLFIIPCAYAILADFGKGAHKET